MNFFQTHKHTHEIPNDVLKRAIVLSPKGDWTDKSTKAYEYLKAWALNEDTRRDGKPAEKERKLVGTVNMFVTNWGNYQVPEDVMLQARALSPGKDSSDKRTKAYKFLAKWAAEQDKNNEES